MKNNIKQNLIFLSECERNNTYDQQKDFMAKLKLATLMAISDSLKEQNIITIEVAEFYGKLILNTCKDENTNAVDTCISEFLQDVKMQLDFFNEGK